MSKTTKIILWILVAICVVIGVLIGINIASFRAFIWNTTAVTEVKNTENVLSCGADENSENNANGLTQCAINLEENLGEKWEEGHSEKLPLNSITNLSRDEAKSFIMEGKATSVAQAHDLTIKFSDTEWKRYKTIEPEIDAIFDIIKQCGERCKDIPMMTE